MDPVHAAALAAEAAEKRIRQQEESMHYSPEDLDQGWEFKIVRGHIGAFRRPAALKKLLEQESQSGWVMLEKFDDSRIRFRRPASARANDSYLPRGVDPYRTNLVAPAGWLAVVLVIGVLGGLALVVLLGLALH